MSRDILRFQLPNGKTVSATTEIKLHHNIWESARTIYIVPNIETNTLLSTGMFANIKYVTILTRDKKHVHYGTTTDITAKRQAILQGSR